MKIYDAREGGGFLSTRRCRCARPRTSATGRGTVRRRRRRSARSRARAATPRSKCKKGYVKKNGKCKKKKKKKAKKKPARTNGSGNVSARGTVVRAWLLGSRRRRVRRAGGRQPAITSFNASVSTSQAGGHPDLSDDFTLEDPGQPEAAKDVDPQPARGRVRQPERDPPLHLQRLRAPRSARPPRRSGS